MPPSRIELHAQGPAPDVVRVVTALGNRVGDRGVLRMADPPAVAAGDGWVEVEVHEADSDDALAVVRSILDQIPGSYDVIVGGDIFNESDSG